jgi:glycerol-3-phosphate dehydrogenase
MLTITGGKLTTWRRMAKHVVDRLVEREGRDAPCRTDDIPLGHVAEQGDLEPPAGVDPARLHEDYRPLLAFRYGHAAREVLRIAGERPELADPIVEGQPDLLAEVVVAARREQARSVADVLLRRTRLGLLAAPQLRTPDSVTRIAGLLGEELGWDVARVGAEGERWLADAAAEGIDPAAAA